MSWIKNKRKAYLKGNFAEYVACAFLLLKGYRLLARRYKTPLGEIDIIAKKWGVLVAVEVKYRPTIAESKASVSKQQQQRICRALQHFQQRYHKKTTYIRFDLIALSDKKWPTHIQNAWQTNQ